MIQIFINEQELDLPVDIGEQIAINYEAFPLGEFRNTFNNFSGNLNFPPTPKNRLIFGHATNNLAPLTVTREYTGRIVSGAIELFYGRVDYERYNNGFECRFVTSGQLLSEEIKQYDMFDVLFGLPAADTIVNGWFDHTWNSLNTSVALGGSIPDITNVFYPLLDLGYFNNTPQKIGWFDLRPTFNLYALINAIALKVNKSVVFGGGINDLLRYTTVTPRVWEYSDRIKQQNSIALKLDATPTTYTNIDAPAFSTGTLPATLSGIAQTKSGIFRTATTTTVVAPFSTTTLVESDFTFGVDFEFAMCFNFRASNLRYRDVGLNQQIEFRIDCDVRNGTGLDFEFSFLPDWNAGFTHDTPTGVAPVVTFVTGTNVIKIICQANEGGFSPNGTTDVYATLVIRYKAFKKLNAGNNLTFLIHQTEWGVRYATGVSGQGQIGLTISYFNPISESYLNIKHNEQIYTNGIVYAADLLSDLKPVDVLKYFMRLTGSYLIETTDTLNFIPFANYDKAEAVDWSGKVNFLQPPIVDYRDNELGKDNWLVYKQDDTNGNLDPYYLGGNLPTNLGSAITTLYEAPFAQSFLKQTFKGSTSIVSIPYYNAPITIIYNPYQNTSITFEQDTYVGYDGQLYKVRQNVVGSTGTPPALTNDYELVDYKDFNQQEPDFRVVYVADKPDANNNVRVFSTAGSDLRPADLYSQIAPLDFQKAITDGYGFIPSTFLDYRQVVVQVSLSDLDIHNLDLKKLVFISELNAYFYINKVEEYTPATNVDTTVTLTMLP